jgi:hypothetical protein
VFIIVGYLMLLPGLSHDFWDIRILYVMPLPGMCTKMSFIHYLQTLEATLVPNSSGWLETPQEAGCVVHTWKGGREERKEGRGREGRREGSTEGG